MATRTPGSRARRRRRPSRALAPQSPALSTALARIAADLTRGNVSFALVGGLAVSARAEPRLTRDVDVAVLARADAEAERVIRELVAAGYRVLSAIEQTRTDRLATVRLLPPGAAKLVVDLLFASCGIEPEIVEAAELIEVLPDLIIPVARTSHLLAMKLLARDDRERPQDLDDLRALLAISSPAELRRVPAALDLITSRGFSRGRDLRARWRAVTRPSRSSRT